MGDGPFADYVGRRVGGCQFLRKLGAGGMGAVFEARHLALDKRVAVKLLLPALAADGTFVKRFVTEARLAAKIEHPNVVQVMNVGRDGEVYFIVMQFIEGRTLAALLAAGPLPPRQAAEIVLQAARGLAAAHQRGIIHRDVKPENILVDGAGVARVADLGLSKSLAAPNGAGPTAALTASGIALGTPHYISPEQATEARTADARSDIYSLGATLYHALAGAPPFTGESVISILNQHIGAPLAPPSTRSPGVPPELDRLVARMMAKDPAARPQSMDEVIAGLEKFLGVGPTAGTVPLAAPAPRASTWKYVALGAAGMMGFLIVLGVLAAMYSPARKAFQAARAFERAHPEDYDGAAARYAEVAARFPKGGEWRIKAEDAARAVERRREEAAGKALNEVQKLVEDMQRTGVWATGRSGAEFPPQLAKTASGQKAAELLEKPRVALRAQAFFAALAEGNAEKAAGYFDPRKDPKAVQFGLGLFVGLVKLGKASLTEFRIENIEMQAAGKSSLRAGFVLKFATDKPLEKHGLLQTWERVGGEWFLVESVKPPDEPPPTRPRPGPGARK